MWKSLFGMWKDSTLEVTDVQITSEDATEPPTATTQDAVTQDAVELATMYIVASSLSEVEAESASLRERLGVVEDEWSTKVGDYMQRNASLRMDVKKLDREAKSLREDLATAKMRCLELEQALENAALGSDELHEDLKSASTPIASLGEGHGGMRIS